jgi:hypothetical protein
MKRVFFLILCALLVARVDAQTLVQGKTPAGASAASTNPVIIGGVNGGNAVPLALNSDGTLSLTITFASPQHVIVDSGSVAVSSLPSLPAGTNVIGKTSIDQTTDGTTNRVNPAHIINSATPSNVSVTNSSGAVLAANSSRTDAVIVNYGAAGCFLARGATAVAGQGIYLAPNGGNYTIDGHNLYRGQIAAITSSGSTTLSVSEGQ